MGWVQEDHLAVAALMKATRRQQEIIARQARVVRWARAYVKAAQGGVEVWESQENVEAETFAQIEEALLDLDEACGL